MTELASPVEKVKGSLVEEFEALEGYRVAVVCDIDVDGLASAVVLHHSLEEVGADHTLYFSPPAKFEEVVAGIVGECDALVAADLGATARDAILDARSEGCRVIIIDHHKLLEDINPHVLVHDTRLCAAELCYWATCDLHSKDVRLPVAYAAFTDYMEAESVVLSEVLKMYDRRKVFSEASLLDYALGLMDEEDRRELAVRLVDDSVCHVEEVFEKAREMMIEEERFLQKAREVAECLNEYVAAAVVDEAHPAMTGRIAAHVAGVKRRPVGVCVRKGKVSVRVVDRRDEIDAAKAVRKAAEAVGGRGGGHAPAAGGVVPEAKVEEFLRRFAEEVRKQVEG